MPHCAAQMRAYRELQQARQVHSFAHGTHELARGIEKGFSGGASTRLEAAAPC